jgi:hypothetical protein
MYVYKTRPCAGFPYSCSCDGLDSHREEERRRGPIINYMPVSAMRSISNNAILMLFMLLTDSLSWSVCA